MSNGYQAISIVIPTYNRIESACRTVLNVSEQISFADEIIIVDQNEISPPCLAEIASNNPKINHFRIREAGLPNARNFGVSKAKGEIIIFCDDDVILSDNFIDNHRINYDNVDIVGVAGRVIGNGFKIGKIAEKINPRRIAKIRWFDLKAFDNFDAEIQTEADHAQGCNMSFRKDVILELGGFDTNFGGAAFLEETDFCIRVRKAGYKMVFDPAAELLHLKEPGGGCRLTDWYKWFYWFGHNYALLLIKSGKPTFGCIGLGGFQVFFSALKKKDVSLFFIGLSGFKDGIFTAHRNQT